MKKTARIIFVFVGVLMPILIGTLHAYAHFSDLVTLEVQDHLSDSLNVIGNDQSYYNIWGLMSFMMGMSFIVIGLLNITIIRSMKKGDYPPLFAWVAMAIYLLSVIYAGNTFEAIPQLYGGIFGLVMIALGLFLTLRNK